jgi:hypothetical protein
MPKAFSWNIKSQGRIDRWESDQLRMIREDSGRKRMGYMHDQEAESVSTQGSWFIRVITAEFRFIPYDKFIQAYKS